MKKTGSLIIFFLFFCCTLFAEGIETSIDSSRVPVGESTMLKFSFSGASSDIKTVTIPKVDGLAINYAGTQRSFQYINGKTWSGIVLSYSITPERTGLFKIPPFLFEVKGEKLYSKEVSIQGLKAEAGASRSGRDPGNILTSVELSKKRVYSGEPLVLRYFILASGLGGLEVKGVEKQPEAKGFVMKKMDELVEDSTVMRAGSELVKSHIYSYVLVPADTGAEKIGGGSVIVSVEERSFFGFSAQKRLVFDTAGIEVLKLPAAGRPERFSGLVGDFFISADYSDDSVSPGNEKKITVKVRGDGNFLSMPKPLIEGNTDGLTIISDEKSPEIKIKNGTLTGEKTFVYSIISDAERKVSRIRFRLDFFNPNSASYLSVKTSDVVFDVKGSLKKSTDSGEKAEAGSDKKSFLPLIALLVVCFGIVAFYFFYDRKKMAARKDEKPVEVKQPDPLPEKRARVSMIELDSVYSSGSPDAFMKFISSAIAAVGDAEKTAYIQDKINLVRYGGASLDAEIKKDIYDGIVKVLSDRKPAK